MSVAAGAQILKMGVCWQCGGRICCLFWEEKLIRRFSKIMPNPIKPSFALYIYIYPSLHLNDLWFLGFWIWPLLQCALRLFLNHCGLLRARAAHHYWISLTVLEAFPSHLHEMRWALNSRGRQPWQAEQLLWAAWHHIGCKFTLQNHTKSNSLGWEAKVATAGGSLSRIVGYSQCQQGDMFVLMRGFQSPFCMQSSQDTQLKLEQSWRPGESPVTDGHEECCALILLQFVYQLQK